MSSCCGADAPASCNAKVRLEVWLRGDEDVKRGGVAMSIGDAPVVMIGREDCLESGKRGKSRGSSAPSKRGAESEGGFDQSSSTSEVVLW